MSDLTAPPPFDPNQAFHSLDAGAPTGNAPPPFDPTQPHQVLNDGTPTILDRVDAAVDGVAQGASFGYADELAAAVGAAMGHGSYDDLVAKNRAADKSQMDRMPVTSMVARLIGGVASPLNKIIGAGVGAIRAPGLLNYGLQGAAMGGLVGAGDSTEGNRLRGAAIGGALGGAVGAGGAAILDGAGSGAKWLAGKISAGSDPSSVVSQIATAVRNEAPAMSQDEIKAASAAAYKASEDAGVIVKPEAFQQFVDELPGKLDGFRPRIAPKAADVISEFQSDAASGQPVTLEKLDELRRIASGASKTTDRNEVRLISAIKDHLDDFVDNLHGGQLVAGDADTAVGALNNARSLWQANTKLRNINDIVEIGDNLNDPNWVKNQFRGIIRKPKVFNQYSPDEQAIIKQIARTGTAELVARMTPLRGVQMAAPHIAQVGQENNIATLQNVIARGATGQAPITQGGSNLLSTSPPLRNLLAARTGGYAGGLVGAGQ